MKRIISILLIAMLMVCLTACGEKAPDPVELTLDSQNTLEGVMDFKLVKLYTTEKVTSPFATSSYIAQEGNYYVDAVFDIKNIGTTPIDFKFFYTEDETAPITVTGENFNGTVYEDSQIFLEDSSYSSINNDGSIPAQAQNRVHVCLVVPKTETDVTLNFKFGDSVYFYTYTIGTKIGNFIEIAKDQEIEVENIAKYKFLGTDKAKEILPSNTSDRWYSSRKSEDGQTFVDIKFEITNTGTVAKRAEKMIAASLVVADKYEYTGTVFVEDEDKKGFSSYEEISPMQTRQVHITISVPDTVINESAKSTIFINGVEYVYSIEA